MHVHTVHRATHVDMPQLLDMMEPFNEGEHIAWDRSRFEHALGPLLENDALGLVGIGRAASGATGYAVLTWGYDLEFAGRDAFLTELYVRPAVQGMGWGHALLAWVDGAARAAGVGAIHLVVRHENVGARKLYASLGFAAPARELLTKPL